MGGNFPITFKTAKVIEPDNVTHLQRPFHALDPPVISLGFACFPTIERITPPLSSNTESIRRHARNHGGLQVPVEHKEVWIAPYIGAVIVHKNSDIAHDPDIALAAVLPQRPPLLKECKLDGPPNFQFTLVL